jgi:hypothetical protein
MAISHNAQEPRKLGHAFRRSLRSGDRFEAERRAIAIFGLAITIAVVTYLAILILVR